MMSHKIKFVCQAVRWFDRVNGNTYHSVRVTRCSDGKTIVGLNAPYEYGYGDQYRNTALVEMGAAEWIPTVYIGEESNGASRSCSYERENNYPIQWIVSYGLKREMIANGTL